LKFLLKYLMSLVFVQLLTNVIMNKLTNGYTFSFRNYHYDINYSVKNFKNFEF